MPNLAKVCLIKLQKDALPVIKPKKTKAQCLLGFLIGGVGKILIFNDVTKLFKKTIDNNLFPENKPADKEFYRKSDKKQPKVDVEIIKPRSLINKSRKK